MECYHYVNIFETKGLEYILVIVFLITLVLFMRHLSPRARPPHSSTGPTLGPDDKLIVPGQPKVSMDRGKGHPPDADHHPHGV